MMTLKREHLGQYLAALWLFCVAITMAVSSDASVRTRVALGLACVLFISWLAAGWWHARRTSGAR